MANDWTFACLVNSNDSTGLTTLYSDYFGSDGIAICLDLLTNPSETYIRIIDRGTNTARYYATNSLFTNKWISVIVSYESSTNELSCYVNGVNLGNNTLGNKTYSATAEWAVGDDFGLYCLPSTFSNTSVEGLYSSFCILDKQADNGFIESFNVFGEPDSASYSNVTFFTDLSKVNAKSSYVGTECSSVFYNSATTTKEIKYLGFDNQKLGIDASNNLALDMGSLWHNAVPVGSGGSFRLNSFNLANNPPTVGFANGWTMVWKGNFAPSGLPNQIDSTWFIQQFAGFSSTQHLITHDISASNIEHIVRDNSNNVLGSIVIPIANIDRQITLTITADPIGEYKAYIDGALVTTATFTYKELSDGSSNCRVGVLSTGSSNQRHYKNLSALKIYDRPLNSTEALLTNGYDLNALSGLICSFSTDVRDNIWYDDTGNCLPSLSGGSMPSNTNFIIPIPGKNTEPKGLSNDCLLKDFYVEETEDAFGLDMGDLWYTEPTLSNSNVVNIDLESGTTNHTVGWTNGYSVTFKGNLAYRPSIPSASTQTIAWFCSGNASLRTDGVDDIFLQITGITGTFLHTQVKLDRNNVYTVTVTASGVYTMYVNGVKRTQETKTFIPLNNDTTSMAIGVLSPKRFYKNFQSIRIYDGVLTDAQASSVLGSELDTYSPLCSYSTNMNSSAKLIDNTGNLADTTPVVSHTFIDTVVETDSGFQPRRKGLQFTAANQHYLKIADLPQIDVDLGCTIIMVAKDFAMASDRTIAWFSDEVATNDLIRILYRTGTPNVVGFNSNVSTGSEIQTEVDANESNRLVFKASNQTQTEPKNTFNKLGSVNKISDVKTEAFVRNGATYDLFIGGVPGEDLPTFGAEQYCDVTIESFILVNGVMDDADIDKIIHNNKVNNVPIELQEKYDFEVIVDFNNVYDDAGTLKVKDLSGNDHDIVARGSAGLGWNNLTELEASQVDL